MNLEEIAQRFEGVRWSGDKGFACKCPAHDDQRASLSVNQGTKGIVLKDHAGCESAVVLAKVGLTFADLMNGNGDHPMQIVATFAYHDAAGRLVYQIVKLHPKTFLARRPDGNGGWLRPWGLGKTPRILYNLPAIVKAEPGVIVYVPEGEKDCNALIERGLTATTAPFGAKSPWLPKYSESLRGRPVCILPDHDAPGHRYAMVKARALHGIAASVKIVHLYDGPIPDKHGRDASDWLTDGHDVEELRALVEAAPEWTPTAAATDDLQKHLDSGVANMERLVAQHHQDLRHLNKVGWYAWDGRRFAPDAEAELVRRAIRTVRAMYHEAAAIEDEKARVAFLNHIRRSESEPEIRRMVLLAQSHETTHVQKPEYFDRDPMLLNVHNGTLDLRTRELRPHRREDHITKQAGCSYDPEATCPRWTAFLETVFDGDADMIAFVQRLAGYCMTGEVREHVLPIFWGDGSNGKTTFIRTLLALMGEYGTPAPADLLVVRKHKDHPTELMVLMGVRFAAAVETPLGALLAETLVKNLTGNDAITARRVFRDFVTFTPTHKLIMATNHKPVIQGTDNAIWRRLLLVPFTVTIAPRDQDVHLLDKLALELPGILDWALEGCAAWQAAGLEPPKQVRVATDSYRQESDHLPAFLEEVCVVQPFAKVEKGAAFRAYTDWCERSGEAPMPKLELGRRFKALGVTDEKSHGRRYWTGIGLVAKEATP